MKVVNIEEENTLPIAVGTIDGGVGVEAEVPNEEMIDERGKGVTEIVEEGMIGNEKSAVIGLEVDQCREVVHLHRHPWHRALSLEIVLPRESTVEIGTVANEGTKVAEGKEGRSRPNDIIQGGNGLDLFRRHHTELMMLSKGDLNHQHFLSRCSTN